MAKCYKCNDESTSREHAPPKCFFPIDYRNNLITVPSCKIHNEETSNDDEYVRNILTMSIKNNQISFNHFFNKSLSSFKKNPKLVATIINSFKDNSAVEINAKTFTIDRHRFDKTIRKIAYALFFDEYEYTWERLLAVMTNQIKMEDSTNDHLGDLFDYLSEDISGLSFKGENPLVFKYSFLNFGDGEFDKALFMMFYEGFPIWIIPDNKSDHSSFD